MSLTVRDISRNASGDENLRAAVREAIATLQHTECCFWACDGPDEPFVSMKTCNICATIQDLRTALAASRGTDLNKEQQR